MSPSSIDACIDSTELTIVMANTGPDDAVYVDLVITLPSGITFNTGTAETGLGTDDTVATAGAADPAISGSTLTFYDVGDTGNNIADTIQAAGGNDTLVLKFSVQSACYITDDLDFVLRFYDSTPTTQYSKTTSETLTALYPSLTVTKTPTVSQVDCGSQQSWTITVTNNGTGNAQVVRIEDTPGAWTDVRTGQPGDPIDMGGGVYGWEINNLAASGGSQVLTLVGALNPDGFPNQGDCAVALRQNNVSAVWGCGTAGDAIDNDPTTAAYDCEDSSAANAPVATLQLPNLVITSITPHVSCTSDGNFSGTISVHVTNNGDGATSGTFTVEVTDGKAWTGTGTHGLALASGGFADVTINTGTWTPDCQPCAAPYSFNATVDLNNDICECNEADNTTGSPTTYTMPSPDLVVDSDALAVVCADDNQVTITGTVTLLNNGCNTAITSNIPMRFTLYDNTGCGGGVVEQWTDTFSSVNIAPGGGTQVFAITPRIVTSDLVTNSTGCQVSIRVEADYNDSVCECDGTDNTYCAENKNIDIPNLQVSSDTLGITCLNDGQFTVSGTVTMVNNGCGANLNQNIPARFTIYDNTGCAGSQVAQWTETLAGVNIPALGGTQVFAITPQNISSDLCSNSTSCQVSLRIEADYTNSICESDGTDNTRCSNQTVNIPDLRVNAVTPVLNCNAAGSASGAVTVNVENIGCGDVAGAVVQLTSSCGSITFAYQTVNLTAGSNSDLTFHYTPTPSTDTCDFTATIDPCNVVCEGTNSNNSATLSNYIQDGDGDGILDACEQGPDGNNPSYDGNWDGIPDINQPNVVSFHTADGNYYVTLAAPNGTQLSGVQALPAPSPGIFPDLISFPYGLFRFTVSGIAPGGSVQVELILPGSASIDSYWKYGREPGNTTVHPYKFHLVGGTGAQIMGNTVALHFIDGQRGDDDLNGGNGIIVDDGGPGSTTPVVHALTREGMIVFMIMLSLLACWMIRKRKPFKKTEGASFLTG